MKYNFCYCILYRLQPFNVTSTVNEVVGLVCVYVVSTVREWMTETATVFTM